MFVVVFLSPVLLSVLEVVVVVVLVVALCFDLVWFGDGEAVVAGCAERSVFCCLGCRLNC